LYAIKSRARAGGETMKLVPCLVSLLAVVSGCLSLNKGSDQVALVSPGKGTAEKPAVASQPAAIPTETVATAINLAEHSRDAARREAELTADGGSAGFPTSADAPGERTLMKAGRAAPREAPPSRSPAATEPAPATAEAKGSEPSAHANAVALLATPSASELKLPTIITGPTEPATVEAPLARPTAVVRMVNSKRISLNYEIKDVGPSGVSTLDLWYTQDGNKWEKYDTANQPRPPFVVDVKDEGLYGFTLIARNGVGLGKRPPRAGDQPQTWVEVDTTKPVVKLLDTQISAGRDGQLLSIRWKASDNNLGPRPITVSYAEQAAGPWIIIATNVENTGVYVWQLPAGVPPRILIRVEAVDLVGNVGMAQVQEPVLLDLSQPSVSIVAVDSVVK
jgi:hypothetical protein